MKKTLMIMLAFVLVIAMSITGTLAYLTSQTVTVENTFSIGEVEITLDEAEVTEYGVKVEGADRRGFNEYKLIPGQEYTKDPIVHFQPESEASFIFIKVTNTIEGLFADDCSLEEQIVTTNGWTKYAEGVYYKSVPANESTTDAVDYPVFSSFKLDGEADVSGVTDTDVIKVVAVAIQSANLNEDTAYAEIADLLNA